MEEETTGGTAAAAVVDGVDVFDDEEHSDNEAFGCLAALFGEPHNNHGTSDKPYVYTWPSGSSPAAAAAAGGDGAAASVVNPSPPPTMQINVPPSSVELMAHMVWESCIILTNWVATRHPLLKGCVQSVYEEEEEDRKIIDEKGNSSDAKKLREEEEEDAENDNDDDDGVIVLELVRR